MFRRPMHQQNNSGSLSPTSHPLMPSTSLVFLQNWLPRSPLLYLFLCLNSSSFQTFFVSVAFFPLSSHPPLFYLSHCFHVSLSLKQLYFCFFLPRYASRLHSSGQAIPTWCALLCWWRSWFYTKCGQTTILHVYYLMTPSGHCGCTFELVFENRIEVVY